MNRDPLPRILSILHDPHRLPWSMHGFGMLRLNLSETERLHIWHPDFKVPEASLIHDHMQWALHSEVISGCIYNQRYVETDDGDPYHCLTIKAGHDAYVKDTARLVMLERLPLRRISLARAIRKDRKRFIILTPCRDCSLIRQ